MKKLCFIHIPKTGGESILFALRKESKMNRVAFKFKIPTHRLSLLSHPIFPKHDTLGQVLKKFDLNGREIFAVTRNPWARMFSLYQHLNRWKYDPRYDRSLPHPQIAAGFASYFDFNQWLNYMLIEKVDQIELRRKRDPTDHFLSVSRYLECEGEQRDVTILRLEHLASDFGAFMGRTGRSAVLSPRPKNKSQGRVSSYRDVYSAESRGLVEEIFFDDIDRFEYGY